jgi:short-subunit dehydrogenase
LSAVHAHRLKVFISGASSGLGAALAAHYARRGATLGLLARREEGLKAAAAAAPAELYPVDVCDVQAVDRAARHFLSSVGIPDLVIANAGVSVGTSGEAPEDLEVLSALLQTNVVGLAATLTPFAAPMRRAGRGTLAGIASVAGFRGMPGSGGYCASKSAAITWLESLRLELRGSGVRVVTVCPGYIATPMTVANPYRMPFLMTADEAARRIALAIEHGRSLSVLPWQMRLSMLAIRRSPNWLFDRLFAGAPRKPRRPRA